MNTQLITALKFAELKHRHQRRKDNTASPYIKHLVDVLSILAIEAGVEDTDVLCAALLHDTVEDTDTSFDEIRNLFGEKICTIVMEVTDDKALPKERRKELQIEHAPTASYEAKLVKMADKIANLRDVALEAPVGWQQDRVDAYFEWSQKVANGLRGAHAELEALLDRAIKR